MELKGRGRERGRTGICQPWEAVTLAPNDPWKNKAEPFR